MTEQKPTEQKSIPGIHWLSDEDYQKAVTALSLQVSGALRPLRRYGQDVYCDGAAVEIVKLCEDFGLRVRGVDKEISLQMVKAKNGRILLDD
jgi:hypothetical protein